MISHEMHFILTLAAMFLSLYVTVIVLDIFLVKRAIHNKTILHLVYCCYLSVSVFSYLSRFPVNVNIFVQLTSTFILLTVYHTSKRTKFKITIICLVLFAFCESLVAVFLTYLFIPDYPDFFSTEVGFLLSSALSTILALIFVKIIGLFYGNFKENIILSTIEIIFVPFSTMFLLIHLVYDVFFYGSDINWALILSLVLLIAINFQVFFLFDKIRITENERHSKQIKTSHAIWYATKEKELIAHFSKFCKLQHNLNYQLLLIKEKLDNNPESISDLDTMITDMLGELSVTKMIPYTKNSTINHLLNFKSISAWSKGIEFRVYDSMNENTSFDESNFYNILGNALDNSIENFDNNATERVIDIHLIQDKTNFLIEVTNPYSGKFYFVDELPRTQKEHLELHGFGLSSIKQIVEDKGGSFHLVTSDGIFSIQIILYNELR